ncbi:MAG TPA: class I SAM-dependent methyltransferase [Vicinamibacterales bacterium]|nr:class I SAM-dependent methyltransferase [Vicinamibacterales bacterium]
MAESANPWNGIFTERGRVFLDVHEDVARLGTRLMDLRAKRVLDLGSGTGRHLVHFARLGFSVSGLDDSLEGTRLAGQWLASEGLDADVRVGSMHDPLPYPDAFFDAVIAVQVIHHARLAAIRGLVAEMTRVLNPRGLVFVTVPAFRNQASAFDEIEPGTFLPLDGPEKGLPHHYFSVEELRVLFEAFDVDDVHVDGVGHFCLSGVKRPANS